MMSQVLGGRKREHRNQRSRGLKLFGANKSKGNANQFAKGVKKKGFLANVFHKKSKGPWVYHKTNPGATQNREQRKLFTRNRTKGKRFTDGIIAQQNKQRSSSRVRGSSSFSRKRR